MEYPTEQLAQEMADYYRRTAMEAYEQLIRWADSRINFQIEDIRRRAVEFAIEQNMC